MNKGRLVYLMGPSGAGKDTLVAQLQAQAPWPVYVPRRYITREVKETDLEQHVYMTPVAFEAAKNDGLFAFFWQANGHQYAIGQDIQAALEQGQTVLINGSREHYQCLDASWQKVCVPVYFQVSAEVQAQRLLSRGRENMAQIQARLARSQSVATALPKTCVVLDANQSATEVYQQFLNALAQWEHAI